MEMDKIKKTEQNTVEQFKSDAGHSMEVKKQLIKDEAEEQLDSTTILYPFKLIFPPNKARSYYFSDRAEKERWMTAIK